MYGLYDDTGSGGLFDFVRKKENVKFETATQEVTDAMKKNYARP